VPEDPEVDEADPDLLIDFAKVALRRGGQVLVGPITWSVELDERWVVIGPNGAGKTSLLRIETGHAVYAPEFDRSREESVAGVIGVHPWHRLVITEGNYLLLEEPRWARARAAMDAVWFVASEEELRVQRLVERHIRFGKTPSEARAWVASTDQRNADLVSATLGDADRVVVNRSAEWALAEAD